MEIRPLTKGDARAAFRSGNPSLDEFFHHYAGKNQFRYHIGVTYVAVEADVVLGYVTVSAVSVRAEDLPSGRRMPRYPLPALCIGRLAVAEQARGAGIGAALLRHALTLSLNLRETLGCIGVVVDAKPDAVAFYAHYDFVPMSVVAPAEGAPTRMFLPLATAEG